MNVYVSLITKEKELLSILGTKIEPHPYLLGKVVIHAPKNLVEGCVQPLCFQGIFLMAKTLVVGVEDIEMYIEGNAIDLDALIQAKEKANGE
jgi:hypothetical protein